MNSEKIQATFNRENMDQSDIAQVDLENRLEERKLEYVLDNEANATFSIEIYDPTREVEDILKEFELEHNNNDCPWFPYIEVTRDGDSATISYINTNKMVPSSAEQLGVSENLTNDVYNATKLLREAVEKFSDFYPEKILELAEIPTNTPVRRFQITQPDGTLPSKGIHEQLLYEAQKNLFKLDPDTNWVESLTLKRDAMGGFLIELDPTKFQKPRHTETDQ